LSKTNHSLQLTNIDVDMNDRGVRVLRGVREHLRYDVVGGQRWGVLPVDELQQLGRMQRVEEHKRCDEMIADDAPWLWIAQPGFQVSTRSDVTGINLVRRRGSGLVRGRLHEVILGRPAR
jgi:hypothetical protein